MRHDRLSADQVAIVEAYQTDPSIHQADVAHLAQDIDVKLLRSHASVRQAEKAHRNNLGTVVTVTSPSGGLGTGTAVALRSLLPVPPAASVAPALNVGVGGGGGGWNAYAAVAANPIALNTNPRLAAVLQSQPHCPATMFLNELMMHDAL